MELNAIRWHNLIRFIEESVAKEFLQMYPLIKYKLNV